ncbi:hypothetical protein BKA70DRAFT_1098806 [Coprinopsis sp. MPI-PUGE-AT-0042]|nr:hypothetical protein BKA70DRAFT_1098806 [Coprinopsis sp. MPI-PUGE-AT-0042]
MNNDDAQQEAALGLLGLSPAGYIPSSSSSSNRLPSTTTSKGPPLSSSTNRDPSSGISCICGSTFDDGFSIACDVCERWCHAACFDIVEGKVPEEWRCWECAPRYVNQERARRIQKERKKMIQDERRREGASSTGGTKKKKRRGSTAVLPSPQDQQIDIEILDSAATSYVHIEDDIYEMDAESVREVGRLRDVDAFRPPPLPAPLHLDSPFHPHQDPSLRDHNRKTHLRPLNPNTALHPALSLSNNNSVRPPQFSLHASYPFREGDFVGRYTSRVESSAKYVGDCLNGYKELGGPRPFVHLEGGRGGLALDSRMVGNEMRWARNGCRPNAVLRPVICNPAPSAARERRRDQAGGKENDAGTGNVKEKEKEDGKEGEEDDPVLKFGLFALRDVKPNEEIVLGWEWDDGNVVHVLPAVLERPWEFR